MINEEFARTDVSRLFLLLTPESKNKKAILAGPQTYYRFECFPDDSILVNLLIRA